MRETTHRWVFDGVTLGFAALVVLLLPFTSQVVSVPTDFVGVFGVAICAADLCTAILLIRQYRLEGERYLLVLLAAYLLGACLVLPMALSFPGAFFPGSFFGHQTTAAILFLSWRLLITGLLFGVVLMGVRRFPVIELKRRIPWLIATVAVAGALSAGLVYASSIWEIAPLSQGRFNLSSFVIGSVVATLALVGAIIAFTTRSQARPLFGWVALVMVATVGEMTLSTLSGGRFTVGWYASRCITVVASYLLLAYLAADFARGLAGQPRRAHKYAFVAAAALAIGAVLLRYFLIPWLGFDSKFATLFAAVAIAVWMGGWRPAVFTAALGFVLAQIFLSPQLQFAWSFTAAAVTTFALYVIACAVIIALGQNMRAAREKYRLAEERFRGSQEAAIQGYGLLRAERDANSVITDFVIEYVNPRGAAFAHQSPEVVIGRRLTEVLPGVVHNQIFETLCEVANTGKPVEVELRYEQEGMSGWFRNMFVKVGDGVAASFFDVTRAKMLERELAQRAYLLERADSNKSRFLATLSHELRNPLAPLRNGLAILKRHGGGHGGGDSSSVLAMMDRQLTQMVRLVDDLLDVSRIDRGKIELRRERVPVDAVVSAAIETARPSIDSRSHELVVRFAQKALHVEGDPVRLAQIVSNLLINAAKFTPPKGRVELALRDHDGKLEITVRDNGVGIDPEQLPRVFEMFVQLGQARDSAAGGLGLGLALVKSLVELHDGRVEARSKGRNHGAEFVVTLPLAATPAEVAPPRPPQVRKLEGRRVLVVDDNEDAARTLGALLVAQGHEVSVYFNAHDALDSASSVLPDVAFLDLNMPGTDGYDLARQLRALPRGASIRIIAVTGMGRESDIALTREVGFDGHLTKPADPERILELAQKTSEVDDIVVPFPKARHSD